MGRSLAVLSLSLLLSTSVCLAKPSRPHRPATSVHAGRVQAQAVKTQANQANLPSPWTSVVKKQPAMLLEPDGTEDDQDAPAGALYTDSDDVG